MSDTFPIVVDGETVQIVGKEIVQEDTLVVKLTADNDDVYYSREGASDILSEEDFNALIAAEPNPSGVLTYDDE